MAKIITFERLSLVINAESKFLEIDSRIDANITGATRRSLKSDEVILFCNNNISTVIPHIFAHKLTSTGAVVNAPMYFTNNILNNLSYCQSLTQIGNFSIVCTSMEKNKANHDIIYWNTSNETIQDDETVIVSDVKVDDTVRSNIIYGLHDDIYEPYFLITDLTITGMTVNKISNKILFSIGNIEAGDDYTQQGIIIESKIVCNATDIAIDKTFRIASKYDLVKVFAANSITHTGTPYITDIYFDNDTHKLIILTSCTGTSTGYVWTVQWHNHLNSYAEPQIVLSNYDDAILKFNQIPKGITKIKSKTYSITFKYDSELDITQHFDYCILELP